MNGVEDQIERSFLSGRNIYISGVGGTGKSYLLKKLFYKHADSYTYLCSTTGISSYNIGGRTIHSWAGIISPSNYENPQKILSQCIARIKRDSKLVKHWKNTTKLFIDEVSMLGGSYLTLLDAVGKIIRKNNKPLGGIQIICTGDMLQLPPVKDVYPFEVDVWGELTFAYYNLNMCYRFDDASYTELLKRARVGELTTNDICLLEQRLNAKIGDIKPTVVLSKNSEVDRINREELDKLEGDILIFKCNDLVFDQRGNKVKTSIPKNILDEINCDERLYIKPGAQVMLTINKDVYGGLANGSRGVVINTSKDALSSQTFINVKFISGLVHPIAVHEFKVEDEDHTYIREGYPLKVCFAMTFHKTQGLTIDCIYADVGSDIFCGGQAYVGLSRCKNLNSLYLRHFRPSKIYANKTALQFEKRMAARFLHEQKDEKLAVCN